MRKVVYNGLNGIGKAGRVGNVFLILLICANAVVIVLESEPALKETYGNFFHYFDLCSVALFSAEYLLRLWTVVENPTYRHPFFGRVRYLVTPIAIIDLLAVLPFYLHLTNLFDLRILRILRVLSIFRLFKIMRYMRALSLITKVLRERKEGLIISTILMFFMLLITSALMYYVEHQVQPEKFSSILRTMWWGIITLTTVGYGDMYPITGLGKLLGGLIAVIGVGLFALPAGLIASGFSEELSKVADRKKITCPHCGKEIIIE
ncbi:MAG: ion transporter [Cytophagales bacterium]|nr:ion transporter [Bernardetiaceae bacterium]MDW8211128.1 ion transporter [Cytophagales bacterium]